MAVEANYVGGPVQDPANSRPLSEIYQLQQGAAATPLLCQDPPNPAARLGEGRCESTTRQAHSMGKERPYKDGEIQFLRTSFFRPSTSILIFTYLFSILSTLTVNPNKQQTNITIFDPNKHPNKPRWCQHRCPWLRLKMNNLMLFGDVALASDTGWQCCNCFKAERSSRVGFLIPLASSV